MLSTPSTPTKSSTQKKRNRTPHSRKSKSKTPSREDDRAKGGPLKPYRRTDIWSKTDEVLNHLQLVGLGDGLPPKIHTLVRQKIALSRKALVQRADPIDITKPLLDLSEAINFQGLETSQGMHQQLEGIRGFLSEATKEKFEERAASLSRSLRAKDNKGIEMKKKLDEAKSVLNQLSDLNELKIAIRNSVEGILKSCGYVTETPRISPSSTGTGSYVSEKPGLREREKKNPAAKKKIYNWKKIEGVLDHLMRVCQRPNIAPDLQNVMLGKIAAARNLLEQRAEPLKITEPLHQIIDILNDHGLESSEHMKSHLDDLKVHSETNVGILDSKTALSTSWETSGLEMRKMVGQTKSYLNYLSDINELKMIVKTSAEIIQRGGTYRVDQLPVLSSETDDESLDVEGLDRELNGNWLPPNLKIAAKMVISRAKRIQNSPAGNALINGPLENFNKAVRERLPKEVAKACNSLLLAIMEYNKKHKKTVQKRKRSTH